MKKFDIIVIGAGSGGLNIAGFMNRLDLSVLLIDKSEDSIGGDCLNHGCVPSKALIHVSRLVSDGREAQTFGVTQSGEVDLQKVMDYVNDRQDIIRAHENVEYFREKGMTVMIGEAVFTGKNSVRVGQEEFYGKKVVIATGSRPRSLKFKGSSYVPVYTNETIFNAKTLPKNLLVVGGGPIGFEIGQSFSKLGSKVTIINRDDMWLGKEDRLVVAPLMERMKSEGVVFMPNVDLTEVTHENQAVLKESDGVVCDIFCDAVFVSIGRILNTENLNLEKAEVTLDDRGHLILNEYLQTTNKNIFAVGDVAGQHQFTHAAELHASLVLSNMFKPRFLWKKLNTDAMAWVTYTDPEIATFGLSQAQLSKRNISYAILNQSFKDNDRSITDSRTEGILRLYVSGKGKILGGTMVGKDAGELIGECILAQKIGIPIESLFYRTYPYPTASRINKLAAGKYMEKKLTKGVVRLLRALY